jgi:uncharacterized LabA/DUF88 family protein
VVILDRENQPFRSRTQVVDLVEHLNCLCHGYKKVWKSFGDIYKSRTKAEVLEALAVGGFELRHIPNRGKEDTDKAIICEVFKLIGECHNIDQFVMISSDNDFASLLREVKSRHPHIRITVIADPRNGRQHKLQLASDRFISIRDWIRVNDGRSSHSMVRRRSHNRAAGSKSRKTTSSSTKNSKHETSRYRNRTNKDDKTDENNNNEEGTFFSIQHALFRCIFDCYWFVCVPVIVYVKFVQQMIRILVTV